VIVCPGGGYQAKAPHEGKPVAERFNEMGVHAFVLSYRVWPYTHPVPLRDAQRAIRLVRANAGAWGLDPRKIAILGFSAGGHLCALSGVTYDGGLPGAADPVERASCRPDAILPCYAVMSAIERPHRESFRKLIGTEFPSAAACRALSPDLLVTGDTPPAFLWHTAEDNAVPVENSIAFASAMSIHKRPFALHIFPSGRHGVGLAEDIELAPEWSALAGKWLHSLGF
jgi:acetyl esterase/lipase